MRSVRLKHTLRMKTARVWDATLPDRWYSVYGLGSEIDEEYVGEVGCTLEEAVSLLRDHGYSYNIAAAKKLHPFTGQPDSGSFRVLDPDDPVWQFHVHLFELDGGVEFHSHYEKKPEPWAPWDLWRPKKHYRPDWNTSTPDEEATYFLGDHEPRLKTLLVENGVYAPVFGDLRG